MEVLDSTKYSIAVTLGFPKPRFFGVGPYLNASLTDDLHCNWTRFWSDVYCLNVASTHHGGISRLAAGWVGYERRPNMRVPWFHKLHPTACFKIRRSSYFHQDYSLSADLFEVLPGSSFGHTLQSGRLTVAAEESQIAWAQFPDYNWS